MLLIDADLLQHPQHRFVRAAVQRAVERRRRAGHRRVRIDVRAADAAHRARAAVLLVIGVEDEEDVERRARAPELTLYLSSVILNSMFRKLPVKLSSLSG